MKGYVKDQRRIAELTRRFGRRISTSARGSHAVRMEAAVSALMEEWNPIHASPADLRAIMGPPTEESPDKVEYVFDNGYNGHRWCFTVAQGIVVGMTWESLD